MKYLLVITGVLAGLALAFPGLVIWGYLLLIVPGLILTIAPTVFIYLAGTAVIRSRLPVDSPIKGTVVSFGAMLVFGWAVMQPFRTRSMAAYQAESRPDVIAEHEIKLAGRVRIEMPDQHAAATCDWLCTAVLDSPGVESVTVVTGSERGGPADRSVAAFQIDVANGNPEAGLFPEDPGQVVREIPPGKRRFEKRNPLAAAKAVEAHWAIRLSGLERLQAADPVSADAADWIIRIDSRHEGNAYKIRGVTVCNSTGAVCFRKTYLKRHVPAPIFYVGFDAHFGAGMTSMAAFEIGKQVMSSGDRLLSPKSELLQAINYSPLDCDTDTVKQLRQLAMRAIDNPAATDAEIDCVRRFLGLYFFDAGEQDYELIAKIVSDDRVKQIDEQLMNVFSKQKTPAAMSDAYAERIVMADTSPKLQRWLAESLATLPAGTFANPTATHRRIWNSPGTYPHAGVFLSRTADAGAAQAVPVLQSALEQAVEIPEWRVRRPVVDGIREALIQIGPPASAVVPRINELFLERPSPLMRTSRQADDWRFALTRVGVSLKDLPYFPSQSPSTKQNIARRIQQKIRRYEQQHIAELSR